MRDTTDTSWCDATFNPWVSCSNISSRGFSGDAQFGAASQNPHAMHKRTSEANWRNPSRWNTQHVDFFARFGRRRRVFCAPLADAFDNGVDPYWRVELWALIRCTPQLDWLLLTRHMNNVGNMLPPDWERGYRNVGLGLSAVDQAGIDRDGPTLLATPAYRHWLSLASLPSSVSLTNIMAASQSAHRIGGGLANIDWVVCGDASEPRAPAMPADTVDRLRKQCAAANVPFLFTQWQGNSKQCREGAR